VLGSSASIIGSELSSLLGSGPSLCPAPIPQCQPDLRIMGDATRGSPIPLQAGIKAHALCEENTHLRHIRRLSERHRALEFRCRAGLACSPPRQPGFSLACAPPRCPKPSLTLTPARAHNTRYGPSLAGGPGPIGAGLWASVDVYSAACCRQV